jgi:CDGSH-type Zn-finger protein
LAEVIITVRSNGPYRLAGPFKLVDADGNDIKVESDREFVALCRCGESAKKPFCDGTHKKIDFQGETKAG